MPKSSRTNHRAPARRPRRTTAKTSPDAPKVSSQAAESTFGRVRHAVSQFVNDGALDHRLDQGVDFLTRHGFGAAQLKHLFNLRSRRQKFLYIASVAGTTVAVTFYSRSLVGRTLRRVPFLRWA